MVISMLAATLAIALPNRPDGEMPVHTLHFHRLGQWLSGHIVLALLSRVITLNRSSRSVNTRITRK